MNYKYNIGDKVKAFDRRSVGTIIFINQDADYYPYQVSWGGDDEADYKVNEIVLAPEPNSLLKEIL